MMDHDLLMMIYGALIGVASSIVTTIFQSWLARRENERRQRQERENNRSQIYTPTHEEIIRLGDRDYESYDRKDKSYDREYNREDNAEEVEDNERPTSSAPIYVIGNIVTTVVIVTFVLSGIVYLFTLLTKSFLYLFGTALTTFAIFSIILWTRKL